MEVISIEVTDIGVLLYYHRCWMRSKAILADCRRCVPVGRYTMLHRVTTGTHTWSCTENIGAIVTPNEYCNVKPVQRDFAGYRTDVFSRQLLIRCSPLAVGCLAEGEEYFCRCGNVKLIY